MTAVPVVSATLTTRTVRECAHPIGAGWHTTEWRPACSTAGVTHQARERLVADPAFVVLDAAPDLTCRECDGLGDCEGCDLPGPGIHPPWRCPSCGGSGVSPVYIATWQWRYIASTKPTVWQEGFGADTPSVQRRQVVAHLARQPKVLPVVDASLPTSPSPYPWISVDAEHAWGPSMEPYHQEPWAVDLRPGQFVLVLDGIEPIDPLITHAVERSDDPDDDYEWRWDTAPLSVPERTLTETELA